MGFSWQAAGFSMTHALICLFLNLLSRAALDSLLLDYFTILIDLIMSSIYACLDTSKLGFLPGATWKGEVISFL